MSIIIEDQKYEALSHQLSLESDIGLLIGNLRIGHVERTLALRAFDCMQRHVQGIGRYVNSHKPVIHHRHLMQDLASLADSTRMKTIYSEDLLQCLEHAKTDVDGLHDYFRNILPPIYWNVRRSEDSTIALKVFAIPELLENILSYCDLVDILNAYRLCKEIRDIIEASAKLQIQLALKPAAEGSARSFPFDNIHMLPEFRCGLSRPYFRDGKEERRVVANIVVKVDPDGIYWPKIGSRIEKMFICQPPIKRLLANEHCQLDDNDLFGGQVPVRMISEKGLTVGQLYRMAERLIMPHTVCHTAARYDWYGWEVRKVDFEFTFREVDDEELWIKAEARTTRLMEDWEKEARDVAAGMYRGDQDDEGSNRGSPWWSDDDDCESYSEDEGSGELGEDADRDRPNEENQELTESRLAAVVYEGYGADDGGQ